MDSFAINIAFALGVAARQIGLPPLVGYLVAGFAIKAGGLGAGAPPLIFLRMPAPGWPRRLTKNWRDI